MLLPRQAGRQLRRGQTALEKTDASIATKELSWFGSDLPPKCYICRERERGHRSSTKDGSKSSTFWCHLKSQQCALQFSMIENFGI